jgi:perosamine synthetase
MPAFTIVSQALSVLRAGGVPVLIDSDADTLSMDVSLIEYRISAKTKAILVIHTYGLLLDMDPVLALCRKYELLLVEDTAEMHG